MRKIVLIKIGIKYTDKLEPLYSHQNYIRSITKYVLQKVLNFTKDRPVSKPINHGQKWSSFEFKDVKKALELLLKILSK